MAHVSSLITCQLELFLTQLIFPVDQALLTYLCWAGVLVRGMNKWHKGIFAAETPDPPGAMLSTAGLDQKSGPWGLVQVYAGPIVRPAMDSMAAGLSSVAPKTCLRIQTGSSQDTTHMPQSKTHSNPTSFPIPSFASELLGVFVVTLRIQDATTKHTAQ